jgi:two-component system LytT family response regulator
VQMPRRTGLEVVRDIGPENMPPTIFVTAYDRYALDAFDVAAVDYLVKPFDDERFEQAFRRARKMIGLTELGKLSDQLRTVLNAGSAAPTGAAPLPGAVPGALADAGAADYLERIAVEMRGQVRVVPVATIEYIAASGPYAEIHVGDRTYIIRERMQTLEERLDPANFFRIHRSVIVKLDQIETLLREAGGDYAVQLRCGARLSVSRNRVEPLEKWMGLAKAR